MDQIRKPFQGVFNIIRFNWHFYVLAGIGIILLLLFGSLFLSIQKLAFLGVLVILWITVISLVVSYYIYDFSDLYQLKWLDNMDGKEVLNINAGFDETSQIIQKQFKTVTLTICDFYDPDKHTEVSIKRAREVHPPQPNTIGIETEQLPFKMQTFDKTLVIFAAHEIRNKTERTQFFKELNRVTKSNGQIVLTEHLRDWKNGLVYSFGCLHFYSKRTWKKTFNDANLVIKQEIKTTPFITTFILENNGNTD